MQTAPTQPANLSQNPGSPSNLLPLKVNRWRRPFLPLSFPFPLPQLKPGWKALAGLPDYSTLSKGRSLRAAPPEIWLAGPPPFPYLARGPHPSAGVAAAAAAGSWRAGMGLATVPGLAASNGQGAEFLVSWETTVAPSSPGGERDRRGRMDFDPNALAHRPGRQSPARSLHRP